MRSTFLMACLGVLLLSDLTSVSPAWSQDSKPMMGSMGDKAAGTVPTVPAVAGYSEGERILFLHTATSDAGIAKILTDMMGSPVLLVPSLATLPADVLARVYVFANGIETEGARGPLGYQPDIFESPPGQPGYTPLRNVVLVTWKDQAAARVLTSTAEVDEAIEQNEVTVEEPGVVVNMPMITWPGGTR